MSLGGRPKPDYDPERLRRLHHDDGLSLTRIAERLAVSPATVSTWMRDSGIEVRRQKTRIGAWGQARGGRVKRR